MDIEARLLNMDMTAALLGASRAWFTNHRKKLETMGFPLPTLCHDVFGGARWDRTAINAWLDSLQPDHLKKNLDLKSNLNDFDDVAMEQELARNASFIAAGLVN